MSNRKMTLQQHVHEINRRLDSLEKKVDGISNLIESVKTQIITLAVRSAIGILVLVCSAVLIVKQ
jgi:tetrahydromethanopterin S-methyltransferase subunit G